MVLLIIFGGVNMSLTENQKNLLRWIVKEVRADHLKEDSIWYYCPTVNSHLWVDYNGFDSTPYVCLLYTSPSPRDGLLSRMPSSA